MNREQALRRMISPGMQRPGKPRGGVIQIWATRACDKSCFGCTQGSNLGGKLSFISLDHFRQACESLRDYFGIVGVFGGNPAIHPQFEDLCKILQEIIPFERRGLWSNNPLGKGKIMRETFNPAVSNLNVHLDQKAFDEFKRDWPEARPFGLERDSRHSPVYTALSDLVPDEGERWNLISRCDINQHWSAMIGVFRGELRGWFCEIAGAQAMLHQSDPNYPDTGIELNTTAFGRGMYWWQLPMTSFGEQVDVHCHSCGVPLKGHGELAQADEDKGVEFVSAAHLDIYKPKRFDREVQVVTSREQLGEPLSRMTHYLQNGENK